MSDKVRVRAKFENLQGLEDSLRKLKGMGIRHYETYAPVSIKHLEELMPDRGSTVRLWATIGAILGLVSFWVMSSKASLIFPLVVGGKPPVSNVPFVVVMYEGTILLGSIAAFISGIVLARLWPRKPPSMYDPKWSGSEFGIEVECKDEEKGHVLELLKASGAVDLYGD